MKAVREKDVLEAVVWFLLTQLVSVARGRDRYLIFGPKFFIIYLSPSHESKELQSLLRDSFSSPNNINMMFSAELHSDS